MRGASLFAVFVLAKILVVAAAPAEGAPFAPAAWLWQDALVALAFAGLERWPKVSWPAYGALALYAAVNVPVARILSTPLTWPMLRAARGTLADSIAVYVTWGNLLLMLAVLAAAAVLPVAMGRVPRRALAWAAGAVAAVALVGPWVVEAQGRHRNALATLVSTAIPRVSSAESDGTWTRRSTEPEPAEDISGLRGTASGRNVVLILLESTGARFLRSYGAKEDPTPNLTRLAREALLFERAYAVYPESIKGLYSVLCSDYPAIDAPAERHAGRGVAWPAVLAEAGYRTGLFHSGRFRYLGMDAMIRGRGFHTLEDAGDIGGRRESSFGVDEAAAVARVLAWIDSGAAPFFVGYLPIAGHHPYASAGGPFAGDDDPARYRNALHEGDAALGALLDGLRERGLYEKTLFVVMGDHGEAFGEHEGNFGHTLCVYEENVRVPLLIAAPGLFREPLRSSRLASLVDTAPTALDLLGLRAPEAWQGRSLLSGPPGAAFFFADYSTALVGLRDGRWKFIHDLEAGRSRLFDLEADPGETRDLSRGHPDTVAAWSRTLLAWAADRRKEIGR